MKSVPSLIAAFACFTLCTQAFAQDNAQSDSRTTERPAGGRGRRGARAAESGGSSDSSGQTNVISRIKDEGMNHSEVMKTLSYLTDVIGPRLTGSPNLKRANEWTKDRLAGWGLTNAHLEAWGPFGRGWTLKRFSAQVIEPQAIPLIAYPNAWSPGFDHPITADVVYFDARSNSDLEKYKGKLRGAIVLSGSPRDLRPVWEPMSRRLEETNLLQLANAGDRSSSLSGFGVMREGQAGGFARRFLSSTNNESGATNSASAGNAAPGGPRGGRFRGGQQRFLSFLASEGAALVVTPSSQGDGGTFFVSAASVPISNTNSSAGFGSFSNAPRAWSTNAPAIPPQMTLAAEHYNRLIRMLEQGEKLKMAVDLKVEFNEDDPMAYNTIAEIPGSDLKNEIVMLGGHLDSWHSGTGATDNGAGVAATMEAVRILAALHLEPRRTIRIGLWTGEEEGLLGSKAYVTKHFGYYTNGAGALVERTRSPKDESEEAPSSTATFTRASFGSATGSSSTNSESKRSLVRQREYEKLSVYFNLDNGAGKIRGVYMQNNEAVRPIFRRWLDPFSDAGAQTLTLANTGGTDHLSFDSIGLPGFQFVQDPLEYNSRTHHSNQDVYDRAPEEDMKQAATIIAAFIYNAAMADERIPRKPLSTAN